MTEAPGKGRYFRGYRVSCQFLRSEYRSGRNVYRRRKHSIAGGVQCDGLQLIADTFRPGALAKHKNRHVRAELQTQPDELLAREIERPQPIECEQHGGGVGTAATQPATHGDAFFHFNICTQPAAGDRLQQLRGADCKVVIFGYAGNIMGAPDDAIVTYADKYRVAEVKQAEYRLQQMIAIR